MGLRPVIRGTIVFAHRTCPPSPRGCYFTGLDSYRNLKVWKKACAFAVAIYPTTATFPKSETFGLVAQLRRAAVSVVCNLAEGQGRWSHADQCKFYYMSRGSLLEVETQLLIACDLGYIDTEKRDALLEASGEIGRMLNGLISSVRRTY